MKNQRSERPLSSKSYEVRLSQRKAKVKGLKDHNHQNRTASDELKKNETQRSERPKS